MNQHVHALVSNTGSNFYNAIGIDHKCNFNLRDTTRCRRNTRKFEFSSIVPENERETAHLIHPCGDDGITRNQLGEDTASSFDAKGKRADIDENNATSSFGARDDSNLNGGAVSDGLIRVNLLSRRLLATEELLKGLLNFGGYYRLIGLDPPTRTTYDSE